MGRIITEFPSISKASEYVGVITFHFQYSFDKQPSPSSEGLDNLLKVKLDGVDCTNNISVVKESFTNKPQVLIITKDETSILLSFLLILKLLSLWVQIVLIYSVVSKNKIYKGNGYTVEKKDK